MVDLEILKRFGASFEDWRKLLEEESRTEPPTGIASPMPPADSKDKKDKRNRLRDRMRSRITEARDFNLRNWQYYQVLDLIWDVSTNAITPTLVSRMAQNYKSTDEAYNALKSLGMDLNSILVETGEWDPKTQAMKKTVNTSAFFNVAVPMVRAYIDIRLAKLINERNVTPMLKYQALTNTPESHVKASVLSSRVQRATEQFGYLQSIRQAGLQMLLYNAGIMFPRENWYVEEQMRIKPKGATSTKADLTEHFQADDERTKDLEKYVSVEGIRYHIPHPSRRYYDMTYPVRTLNYDIGCVYCGHWKALRFRELKGWGNEWFYNLDRVTIGNLDWWTSGYYAQFLQTVLNRCVLTFPTINTPTESKDRETYLANNMYYNQSHDDNTVMVHEHYEKIVPKEEGLGDYPYPIWARFVLAGDGTIIHASPLGYSPAVVFADNLDDNRILDSSLGMKLAPYQDQIQNLLAQYLLAVKQNLANITLIDQNIISDKKIRERIENLGEGTWRRLNLFLFDSNRLRRSQHEVQKAIYSHRFPALNTSEILQAIRTVIDLAERVLQFSSQEIAQAASHEQTEDEIHLIASSTTNVLSYTGIPMDEGMKAMGKQQYEAIMNFGEDDFFVSIPAEIELSNKKLEELGITVLEAPVKPGDGMLVMANKKSAMDLLWFAVNPSLHERKIDIKSAQAMAVFFRDIMNNPLMASAIGSEQAIMFANQIAKLAGLPMPAPLEDTGKKPGMEDEQSKKMLEGVINQVLAQVKEGLQPVMETIKSNQLKIDALYNRLGIQLPNVTNPANQVAGGEGAENPEMVATV